MKQSRLAKRKLMGTNLSVSKSTKPTKKRSWKIPAIIGFIILLVFVLFYFLGVRNWNGHSKIAVAVQEVTGNVIIVIIDPSSSSISKFDIPSETEVQAANQLGTWKIGSITKLGRDKKLKEGFLKNTVIKSFNFPIDFESDESFLNLTSGNLVKEMQSLTKTSSSSFSLLDRIRIAVFSLQVSDTARFDTDLSKTSELERVQLVDGSLGFRVTETIPTNIESYFTIQDNLKQMFNVLINNGTGSNFYAALLGKAIEVIGVNVASIQNVPLSNSDCTVTGLSKDMVFKIAQVFSCQTKLSKPSNNFDIQIDLGSKFKDRF